MSYPKMQADGRGRHKLVEHVAQDEVNALYVITMERARLKRERSEKHWHKPKPVTLPRFSWDK